MQFRFFTLSLISCAAVVSAYADVNNALQQAGAAISNAATPTINLNSALNHAGSMISNAASGLATVVSEATSVAGSAASEVTKNASQAYDAVQSKYSSYSGLDNIQSGFESAYASGSGALATFMSTQTVLAPSAASAFVQDVKAGESGAASAVKNAATSAINPTSTSNPSAASMVGVSCTAVLGLVAVVGIFFL